MRTSPRCVVAIGCIAALASLSGCLSPNPKLPDAAKIDAPPAWNAASQPLGNIDTAWWQNFGDPQLSQLVEVALAHNNDLRIAASRIDQARAQAGLARSARFPSASAQVGAQRARTLGDFGVSESTAIQPEVTLSWELDLWGQIAALSRAAQLQVAATQAQRDGAALSIAATTAQSYITLISLDTQLYVTRETLAARRAALDLATDQARVGYISQLTLTQAQSEFEAVEQSVAALELAIRRQENALRILTGELPGPVAREGLILKLKPPSVPGVLPSQLLRRRPDIVAAELQLAASDNTLSARRADFLPQVALTTSIGRLYVDALDYDPLTVWNIGGSILAPIFNAGRLQSQVDAAAALRDQAAYAYRGAVLQALGEVENALSGTESFEHQIEHVRNRRQILQRSLALAHDRYRAGYASYLDELDAQRNLYATELAAITVRENQLNNIVALYRALGGGWNSSDGALNVDQQNAH